MKHGKYLIAAALIIIGMIAWSWAAPSKGEADTASHDEPATVEHIEGSDISRVILTQKRQSDWTSRPRRLGTRR